MQNCQLPVLFEISTGVQWMMGIQYKEEKHLNKHKSDNVFSYLLHFVAWCSPVINSDAMRQKLK